MNIHQLVSGKYSFYTQDAHGNSTLHSEADNLITNVGMDQVSQMDWNQAFTAVAVGTGTNAPSFADTTLQTPVLSALYSSGAHGQGYTTGTMINNTTCVYRLGRPYLITNTSGATRSITEVATMSALNAGAARGIFSRALLPSPITLAPNATLGIIYELRLTISSLSGTGFTTFNGGALGSQKSAIMWRPIEKIETDGSSSTQNSGVLEPNRSLSFGYASDTEDISPGYAAFASNPATVAIYPDFAGTVLGTFTRLPYTPGSNKVIHTYLVSPTLIPASIRKLTIRDTGYPYPNYVIDFASGYPYSANFTKIHFELSWARA